MAGRNKSTTTANDEEAVYIVNECLYFIQNQMRNGLTDDEICRIVLDFYGDDAIEKAKSCLLLCNL